MWQERADYGHFFYRIPNGESAADAYDRVSGFNESLWRSFGEDSFASVCVLVTHGLMTRVFLMKWYHFSVEYFEDLRNVDHCEFVVMKLNPDNGKYILQNQLRTWSELRRERKNSRILNEPDSPAVPVRKKWGGCQDGSGGLDEQGNKSSTADVDEDWKRRRQRRKNTADMFMDEQLEVREHEAHRRTREPQKASGAESELSSISLGPSLITSTRDGAIPQSSTREDDSASPDQSNAQAKRPNLLEMQHAGRDGGGSRSGVPSHDGKSESNPDRDSSLKKHAVRSSMAMALSGALDDDDDLDRPRADALGDQSEMEDEDEDTFVADTADVDALQMAERHVDGSVR